MRSPVAGKRRHSIPAQTQSIERALLAACNLGGSLEQVSVGWTLLAPPVISEGFSGLTISKIDFKLELIEGGLAPCKREVDGVSGGSEED